MIAFLRMIWTEYRIILKDPGVRLIFLAGLIIYPLVYPVPYMNEVLREIPVIPVDLDHSAMSRSLIRWVGATEEVRLAEPCDNRVSAEQRIIAGDAMGMFIIPKGFEKDVLLGNKASVSVYGDSGYFLIYRQISTGLTKAVGTLSAGVEIRRYTATGITEKQARRARDPLPIVSQALFNPIGGYAIYALPAVLILVMQQTLLIGIGMISGTRNEAPGEESAAESALASLIGRACAYYSIYILYPLFYTLFALPVYEIPSGAPIGPIIFFLTPFLLAVIFLGLALNGVFKTRETSVPVLLYTSMPAVFLIGFAYPGEAIPIWLRYFSFLLPTTAGASGFIRLNQMGASLYEVRVEYAILWAICILYFLLAWLVALPAKKRPAQKRLIPFTRPLPDANSEISS